MYEIMLLLALISVLVPLLVVSDNATDSNTGRCRDYGRPNPVCVYCPDETSRFTDQYINDLEHLLSLLPSRKTSPTGFTAVQDGEQGARIEGRAMCRGDVDSIICEDCIKNASREILKECKSEDAILWNELCQVQYSFNRITEGPPAGKHPSQNFKEREVLGDKEQFKKAMKCLMKKLVSKAKTDSKRFAVGEKIILGKKINGLAQCAADIEPSDCDRCFTPMLTELERCCSFRNSGAILDQSCNLRFQVDNQFYGGQSSEVNCSSGRMRTAMLVVVTCVPILVAAGLVWLFAFHIRRKKRKRQEGRSQIDPSNLLFLDLQMIEVVTNNFSDEVGQGGFGTVYKGMLSNGKQVAVKRLLRKSWQGFEEFKNEIELIAKLQHRNLVRLLGWGMEGEEKILIYELMSNKSLDLYILDSEMSGRLDWQASYNIIRGIANGLVYLHEDSRLNIIHRDLKPSNVLLDSNMVAKISDFGMARIFGGKQETYMTRRPVGTYGYMSPEYAMAGIFSVKSDVFSFGVIVLEIISGKRNSTFPDTRHSPSLLAHAWSLWSRGMEMEFIKPSLRESCSVPEVKKCIHIGLSCVQEDADDRPTMSSVMAFLDADSAVTLPKPKLPAVPVTRAVQIDQASTLSASFNVVTVSTIAPR